MNIPFKIALVSLFIAFFCNTTLLAQEVQNKKIIVDYTSIDVEYIAGGQLYNNSLIFTPGYGSRISAGKKIHKDIDVGLGIGYISLTNEQFYPCFFEISSYKNKKDNTPFVKFQLGYSFGMYKDEATSYDYDLDGGAYFTATLGRRVRVNEKFVLVFQTTYYHQTAKLKYRALNNDNLFTDKLNYELVMLSLGVIFN